MRAQASKDSCWGAQTCRGPVVPHTKHLTQLQSTEAELKHQGRAPGPTSPHFTAVKLKLGAETFSKSHQVLLRLPKTSFNINFPPNT